MTAWQIPQRRTTINVESGPFIATVGFRENGHPFEVFFTARGRSGTDLDDLLYDLGVKLSKAMQHDES